MGALLEVRDLVKHFPVRRGFLGRRTARVHAVDGISLTLEEGQTLGLVGESGCGKSTAARTVLRLLEPTSGTVLFDGKDVLALSAEELRLLRREMQIVFQDPFGSLNPRLTVRQIVEEPLRTHRQGRRAERRDRVAEALRMVGLLPEHMDRFPHEFSGGQRQRIAIARALVLRPRLVVADEPVSALDVSVQAQVLNLLGRLQRELGVSYLFVSHDLGVVRHMSHRVSVMYLGRIVEEGPTRALFGAPLHPYTRALLSAVPEPDPRRRGRERIVLEGDVPSPLNPPRGCRFHPRCPERMPVCEAERPVPTEVRPGHRTECHLYGRATGTGRRRAGRRPHDLD